LYVYFDNTKEPIIWEILERIKTSVDVLQQEKSREAATEVLGQFGDLSEDVGSFQDSVGEADEIVQGYIEDTDESIVTLSDAQSELETTIGSMDEDISTVSTAKNRLQSRKNQLYYNVISELNYIDSMLDGMNVSYFDSYKLDSVKQKSDSLRNQIESYNDESEESFREVDSRVSGYRQTSQKGKEYLDEIDDSISMLRMTRGDLYEYKGKLGGLKADLGYMEDELRTTGTINPEMIVNPIKFYTTPVYVPYQKETKQASPPKVEAADTVNLIGLQTIFPKLLLLIVMFISLLISTFLCLSEINSSANIRVSVVRDASFHEFIATYFSTLLIVIPPIMIVIMLGYFTFGLNIPLWPVLFALFILATIIIMVGMSLSYLVIKESVTLLITTFLLIFMLFFSGYVLPIERMSPWAKVVADLSPGKVTLDAFNKLTFYSQDFFSLSKEFNILIGWCVFMLILTYVIKLIKNL
jgi:ABC-type multidrug transport system permease subunit